MSCNEECWTPVPCPAHGSDMTPRGRAAPLEMFHCCDNYADPTVNPRHLWSEHDDARWYVDRDGWERHVAQCDRCGGGES